MKDYKEIVRTLLTNNSDLRDDDHKLVANIWWMTLNSTFKHRFDEYELKIIHTFLKMYSDQSFPNEQTIRRDRRKLQEQNKSLQGKLWKKRHEKAEEVKYKMSQVEVY
jgi:hypothetical protein